jgi:protein-tyrosine phosphatase
LHTTAHVRRFCVSALLVALSVASPIAAKHVDRAPTTIAGASNIRIENFGEVGSTYYRGSQPEGRDYADLASLGVKTVINLTSDDADPTEKAMTEQAGMAYVQIPMTTHQPPTSAQLAQFLGIANDPARQPIYVHCVGGHHRTGVMTAAYRMTAEGWTADQAFKEMKQYGFGADALHSEFKSFVYHYPAAIKLQAESASASAVR